MAKYPENLLLTNEEMEALIKAGKYVAHLVKGMMLDDYPASKMKARAQLNDLENAISKLEGI